MREKLLKIIEFLIDKLKTGEHTMDIEGFLLASGFALMVVLVGWASQITSKSKETKELEGEFLKKAKLKKPDYQKMINDGGATDDSFTAAVDFLYSAEEKNVDVFNKIKRVKEDLQSLDKKYSWRFWMLLFMSISLFASGIVAFFISPTYKLWTLVPNSIFVIIVFCNLIKVHNLEKRYTENIYEAMEKL